MKTLYIRIVLVYLVTVILSLVVGVIISISLHYKEINEETDQYLTRKGKAFVDFFQENNLEQVDSMMNVITEEQIIYSLYSYEGLERRYGYGEDVRQISEKEIKKILEGNVYREDCTNDCKGAQAVGLPFQNGEKRYAIVIQLLLNKQNNTMWSPILNTTFFLILGIGSICFLLGARYLIKPLQHITRATKLVAKGNFNINLKTNRTDELGVLVKSFEAMIRELESLELMRKEFVSNVSHEIQSPLTSIYGFSKALKKPNLSEEVKKEYIEIIERESLRLSRLSTNLLNLASLESNHHPFHLTDIVLHEQLRNIVVLNEPQWSKKKIEIELELLPVMIKGDDDQLSQVWTNLIQNSIKFTPEGGKISICMKRLAKKVVVKVIDTGIGIEKEEQQHIFERFYKVDKARTHNGSGIGLSIVKKIIELHNGQIEVESTIKKGTIFTISLPYKQTSD
ncbi:two-component sensor histidine kinase [Bacillus pseudomycoides]|uniref:sensor histidine kinase n=1 Tax=Bacillus pseudomycoides TaxID=64104 RepID=UPI000BED6AB4|nr:HAMP domain-containing sensor histidine kinase [Bacillus pseudomycoides]PEF72419.1 two-component sensor histidine kinase [Bacillus pseudomycoides]PEL85540.1 two-component sensor histidine kinase [Bacillus pseudomycoides]